LHLVIRCSAEAIIKCFRLFSQDKHPKKQTNKPKEIQKPRNTERKRASEIYFASGNAAPRRESIKEPARGEAFYSLRKLSSSEHLV